MPDNVFNTRERVRMVVAACKEIREGVGTNGDWTIDLHQKFDYPDALRCCRGIEDLEPYLVEDPTREEQFLQDIPRLRQMTSVPIAAGEEWGQRWDFNRLVENHEPLGRAIRQRPHQNAMHDGENRGIRADAERERQDDDGRKPGIAGQSA